MCSNIYTVFQKKLHPFYFCNNFVDPGLICIIFGSDTPEENCNKTCIVFPTIPIFCAPTVPFKTSKLSDWHSQWWTPKSDVKLGKTQDKKTLTKHAKTSQDSQSKFSKCRPLAFAQVRSCTCHWSMAWSMTDYCIPDHAAIRRRFRLSALCISVWYTQSCMVPQTL